MYIPTALGMISPAFLCFSYIFPLLQGEKREMTDRRWIRCIKLNTLLNSREEGGEKREEILVVA